MAILLFIWYLYDFKKNSGVGSRLGNEVGKVIVSGRLRSLPEKTHLLP